MLYIQKDLEINEKEVAILASVTFMVCGALTIFTAPMMRAFPAKNVIVISQLCNAIGSLLFMATNDYWTLVAGRVLNGIAQAFLCTYAPVWINEFAPKANQTTWMAFT